MDGKASSIHVSSKNVNQRWRKREVLPMSANVEPTYYRLELDDYSAAAFTSFGKYYYGTLEDLRKLLSVWNLCSAGCAESSQRSSSLASTSSHQGWMVIILPTEYQIATDHRLRDWPVVCCVQKRLYFHQKQLRFWLLRDFLILWWYNLIQSE